MNDFFKKAKSKKHLLLQYLKQKHYAKTSDVLRWGLNNYSGRARTAAQELCMDGYIKRLDKSEKVFRFGNIREDVYEFIKDI